MASRPLTILSWPAQSISVFINLIKFGRIPYLILGKASKLHVFLLGGLVESTEQEISDKIQGFNGLTCRWPGNARQ